MTKSSSSMRKEMIADLQKSGIHERHIPRLGFKVFEPEDTAGFMRSDDFEVPAYEIPYFNHLGKRINYSRLKNLEEAHRFGPKKSKLKFKYLQKPNSPPHLYIPPIFDWPRIGRKIKVPRLLITEGEKKAIKACLCKLPCVALGGVDSFRSRKRNIQFLPEFDHFDLEGCKIELCFDSDVAGNDRVRDALNSLAAELSKRGPESICYVMLDSETTDKQGLDDFLAEYTTRKDARKAYAKVPRDVDSRMQALWRFNSEVVYVKKFGRLYNIKHQRAYASDSQVVTEYGAEIRVPDPLDSKKLTPAIKVWLEYRNPRDTNVHDVVYEPGMSTRYRQRKEDQYDVLNMWKPITLAPVKGSVTPWMDLLEYIFSTHANVQWFLKWLAYPLQRQFNKQPPIKQLQGVFVHSAAQGIGKNFVVEPFMKHIYEDAYHKITAKSLEGDFNAWLRNKGFIFGEEIFMSVKRDRESAMGELNALITSDTVDLNMKFAPFQTQSNYTQMYLTSNHSNALALSENDRRMMVVHAPELKKSKSFYDELDKWANEGGAAKILNYLLEKVDISDYNPKGHAPVTDDKKEVIEHSMDNSTYQVNLLLSDPKPYFTKDGHTTDQDIFSASDIHRAMNMHAKENGLASHGLSPSALGRYLIRMPMTLRRRMYISGTNKTTLYCLFNTGHWSQMTDKDWKDYYKKALKKYEEQSRDPKEENVKAPEESTDGSTEVV